MNISEEIKKRTEIQEKWRVFSEMQKTLEQEGTIPMTPVLLLRRYENFLETFANILLGSIIGLFTLLLNFIIFAFLLHIEF